ncbi:MAG: universal stress protein [Actinomycetota bacterium]|nr:universal stress protein [Actinomycetota bacterium]
MGDLGRDASTVDWALSGGCGEDDIVHIVHAFVPLLINECSWEPIREARQARHDAARMVVARALRPIHHRRPSVRAEGSAVAGLPGDVLTEFSEVVDLVIVGDDRLPPMASAGTTATLVRRSTCPVVVVPASYQRVVDDARPVIALVYELGLRSPVISFALDEAARLGTTLKVAQYWLDLPTDLPITSELLADRQQQLDMELADLRERVPSVGVIGEIILADTPLMLEEQRRACQLLAVSSASRHLGELLRLRGRSNTPVVVVPACWPGRTVLPA